MPIVEIVIVAGLKRAPDKAVDHHIAVIFERDDTIINVAEIGEIRHEIGFTLQNVEIADPMGFTH